MQPFQLTILYAMRKTASTNYENQQELEAFCDAAYTLSRISGRWKLTLLVQLQEGPKRFSALKQALPLITERVLSLQLKELEQSGLITKQQDNDGETGKIFHYTLSPQGLQLAPVIAALAVWGKAFKPAAIAL